MFVSAFVLLSGLGPCAGDFLRFKEQFGRVYSSADAEKRAQEQFCANLERLEELRAGPCPECTIGPLSDVDMRQILTYTHEGDEIPLFNVQTAGSGP